MLLKPILLTATILLFVANSSISQIVINEASNRNYLLLADEDNEYPDWIELYNAGNQAVNLANYSLSDKNSNPTKWVFPDIEIQPHEYKIVFCSGKDRRPVPGFTHVVTAESFNPEIGWNTHFFSTAFFWDGVSSILINTCSYNSVGYTSNSVFNQTTTTFLSTVFTFQDGSSDVCTAAYGTPVYQRPNMQLNGITIGTGEIQNSNTGYPAPYGNWYWCARHQMLILASELSAAGVTAGFISSLAFDVASTDPNTWYDYVDISMKMVSSTSVSSKFGLSEPSNTLHTNFKISESGETIYLFSPEQVQLSSLYVDCQDIDNSRGLSPDASTENYLFQVATPAGTNNLSPTFTEYLDKPWFSVPSGYYESSIGVTISNPNGTGSTVHYTTDGSEPTIESPLFTGDQIFINESKVLKAKAFKTGKLSSKSAVSTYLFNVDHTTPVLSVVTDNSNLYGPTGIFDNWIEDWERYAYVEYFDSTKQLIFSQRAGIQVDGGWGGSRYQPQHSFRLEMADGVLGDGPINYPFIPNRPERNLYSKFYLRNGSNQYLILPYKDACQVDAMSNGINNYHSAWRPVSVYINGAYFGLYELREKMDSEYFETLDGASPDSITILSQSAFNNGVLRAVEGDVDPFFQSWNAFNQLNPVDTNFWNRADSLFDLVWYNDYIIGESWMGNTDWPWNNIKIYRSDATNNRWRFCLIDLEISMLPNAWTDCNFDHIAYMLGHDPATPYLNVWLKGLQNERFKNYFINRFADVMNTSYRYERLAAIENTMYTLTQPEMPNEFARWGDPNNIPAQMFAFGTNHFTLRNQFMQRTEQVRNHIMAHANLPNQVEVNLDVYPPEAGKIHISTITPEVLPWQGVYFNGLPITIAAVEPAQGYQFSHWASNGLISDTLNPVFQDTLNAENVSFVAYFEDETTGTNPFSNSKSAYSIFPNPAKDLIHISGNLRSSMNYQLIDMNGNILLKGNLKNTETEIDIRYLAPSVYLIQLSENAKVIDNLHFIKIGSGN